MEENKKKGPGLFYAIIGVATLVVAIIGASYAYFSASKTAGSGVITGTTNNISTSNLTLNVNKITFSSIPNTVNNNLVPAYLNNTTPAQLDGTDIGNMITAKCVSGGYTGCHVYSIEVNSSQAVSSANLLLDLSISTNTTTDKSHWGFVVFKSTSTAADIAAGTPGTITVNAASHGAAAAIGNGFTDLDIHNGAALGTTSTFYYLMVFLNDNGVSQNINTGDDATNYAVGSYTGSLELQAMGGQVRTTFTS